MRTCARTFIWRVCAALTVCVAVAAFGASIAMASGGATYSSTQTLAVPPASNFSGSSGGDGWAVALSSTSVYNIYHHNSVMQVACHDQTTAASCPGSPYVITDSAGFALRTPTHASMYLDQATGKLYGYATDSHDLSVGVGCFNTNTNTSCGFIRLTAANEGVNAGWSGAGDLMRVGDELYAFNYVYQAAPGGPTGAGAQNRLLCFDVATNGACSGQPYAVNAGTGFSNTGNFPTPGDSAIGSKLIIPNYASAPEVACFDAATKTDCAGSWPVATSPLGYYAGNGGGAYPLLDASGNAQGVCFPTAGDPCLSFTGTPVATPANMSSAIGGTSGWNGGFVQIGSRVYVASVNTNRIHCYDASTHAGCANFPHWFANLGGLYTVNVDPQRPTCLWVNADGGSAQIQNVDAFTGGACGAGQTRVLTSQFIVNQVNCYPSTYTSLQVTNPAPGSYTSGSVQFADGGGNIVSSIPAVALDANGVADLSQLNLSTVTGLPQYLITLNGASTTQLTVTLTWTADYDPACTTPDQQVQKAPTTATATLSDGTSTGTTLSVTQGTSVTAQATLTGDFASAASGSITYAWYSDPTCSTVAAGGTAQTITAPGTIPASDPQVLAPGTYYATATYSGDAGNEPSQTSCGDLRLEVVPPDSTPPVTTDNAPSTWQNVTTTVTLTATDDKSGVAATYYSVDGGATQTGTTVVLATEGSHTITYWSVDNAGNIETAHSASVEIDETAPSVTASPDRPANPSGWYNAQVTVTFTCSDALSGVADCPASQTFGQGTGQSASGTGHDKAGNAASASVTGINVDTTAPTLSPTVAPNAILLFGTATVTPNAADAGGSGLASVTCGTPDTSTVGTRSVSCTATDNAGNTTTASASYTVYSAMSYKQDALAKINAMIAGASKNDAKQLSDAAAKLQEAMSATYWIDGIHLTVKGGVHVFNGEKQAIDKLNLVPGTAAIVQEIEAADRILAQSEIDDATAANGNASLLATARTYLAQGDAALAQSKTAEGIAAYMNAWIAAEQSVGQAP